MCQVKKVKERDKKDKCTCIVQVDASTYTLFMILLSCIVFIIMLRIHVVSALISVPKCAKWLLKVTHLEKYVFET